MEFGLIVDLETTGTDLANDHIIEIGLVEFAWGGDRPPTITSMYSALEDPGVPLSDQIKSITGLADPFLKGRKIDWSVVIQYFERAAIVIAHNASFDSTFLRRREELQGVKMHWGCSLRFIDWRAHGIATGKLTYLAAEHGFLNPFAHRALFDCATTFRLVVPHLDELIARSFQREYLIGAFDAPYAVKEKLRERFYKWNNEKRVWEKRVFESELASEREFLRTEIYNNTKFQHREEEVSLNAL